jgi:peptidyl-prolyl cis-trans isomerase B (cyclophilin B)
VIDPNDPREKAPEQQSSAPHPPANAPAPPTNGTAILALIFAILFAPLGLILAYVARSQIERSGDAGRGLVTAALIIGWILTLGWIVIPMIAATIAMFTVGG